MSLRACSCLVALSVLLSACGHDATGPSLPSGLSGEIAYLGGTAILIRDLASGSTRRIELAEDERGAVEGALAWSPQGDALVFAPLTMSTVQYELHRIPLDGSAHSILYPVADATQGYPAFSPDGRLGYWTNGSVDSVTHGGEIFADGQLLTRSGELCMPSRPAWSPDGTAMIVVERVDGVDRLVRTVLATGAEDVVLQASTDQNDEQLMDPVYSHSGDRVAFTRAIFGPGASETDEIWVVHADGSNPQRLTSGSNDLMPTWSPDDAWIAFQRDLPGSFSIALVPAAGGSVVRLTDQGASPAWR